MIWTHKVVKAQRGSDGRWFRYAAAATFDSEAQAAEYAERFAADQATIAGTKIVVVARKGDRIVRSIATAASV